ncbi:MAG: hypothetical protein KME49_22750 [Brasilonema octagenarum HA4186-MV1]|jgi:hypothetical protein|nr:hypothetical protein [Brasilonema octagenarum HA4186-MV1]
MASLYLAQFAFWLNEEYQALLPNQFKTLLQAGGILTREATKLRKLAQNTKGFSPEDLAELGPMMLSLVAPKFLELWVALADEGRLTQDVVEAKKKELYPSKKRSSTKDQSSLWRRSRDGVNRVFQIPQVHNQELGVRLHEVIDKHHGKHEQAIETLLNSYDVQQQVPSSPLSITQSTLGDKAIASGRTTLNADELAVTLVESDIPSAAIAIPAVQVEKQALTASSPALSPIEDEQTRAQAELEAYMEEQSNAIALEPKNIVYSSTVNSANTEVESIVTNYQENPSPAPSVEPSVVADTNQQPNTDTISVTNIPDLPTLQTENPLYVVIGTNDCWDGVVVTIQQTSDSHYQVSRVNGIEWNNINPKHLTPISQDQAQILMNEPALAQRVFDEFGLAVGDTVEFVTSEAVEENSVSLLRQQKLSGKISRLTLLGAFIDEGVPGQSWFPYDRLKKVSLKTDTASFTLERQEQLKQERNQKELIATAKIIKQCDREIVLAKEHLRNQPLDDRQYAHTIHKIDINTTRRSQQLERITNFAHSNDIWLDLEALKENRLVLEPGGEDAIADYLPLPWVQSEPTEPVSEPNPEPEDTSLYESLRQAQNWEQITQLTGRNALVLALAVSNWSPQEKQKLIDYAVLYLESHPNAIFDHELDWLPLASVQKVYSAITFRVRDNSEGIGKSKWIEGCRFVDIEDYGKVDEIWRFLTVDNQQIYAVGRKDIEVEIF